MSSPWYRIEGRIRSAAMTGGVEARIADPLWMLARQWQVGEFIGDDAGTPLAATTRFESTHIDTVRLGPGGPEVDNNSSTPLERDIEAAAPPVSGNARLSQSARTAQSLVRALRRLDNDGVVTSSDAVDAAVSRLADRFPLRDADADEIALGSRGAATSGLLRRRAFDGLAAAAVSESDLFAIVGLSGSDAAVSRWRATVRSRFSITDGAWRSDRMEHDAGVSAPTPTGQVTLRADGYTGGRLDWYSFDVVGESHGALSSDLVTSTTMPTSVEYDGMPASRWWEFEDRSVQFGDLDAGPTDLARMIVADFATVYGDDWYVVPLELANGTITRVRDVTIVDNFGETTPVPSIAGGDERAELGRSWSMFEMHGDTSVDNDVAPLLFLPPVLATSLHGPALERVEFARDEGANLGWAIERTVEGPMGRPIDRREAWLAATQPRSASDSTDPTSYDEQYWQYRLESAAPPFWVPLVPERIDPDRSDIHFRRGRLQSWEHLDDDVLVGAHGETLEPHQALVIREEEIPRGGISVERRWQYARWVDGSVHVWLQRRRRQGRGERSSGLSWDRLEQPT